MEKYGLDDLILTIDVIMHDKQYRFKNEDGTYYSRESCKDLSFEEMIKEIIQELDDRNEAFNTLYNNELLYKLTDLKSENTKLKKEIDKLT